MKKLFTLLALALCAVGASAQSWWKATASTAVAADTKYVDDDVLTVQTVYAGTISNFGYNYTSEGQNFEKSIQIRTKVAPSAETPTGTENSGSTPLVITAKKNLTITFYYHRQAASDAYASNDGKDAKLVNQSSPATAINADDFTFVAERTTGYGYVKKSYKLTAGSTYTLYATGTTVGLQGFCYDAGAKTTTTVNAAKTDQTYYGTSDAAGISEKVNEITFPGIATFTGTNIQAGSTMFTIDTKTYKSFKVAKGSTYVITPASGITINSATLYALSNSSNAGETCIITTGDGDTETGLSSAKETPTKITLTKNGEGKYYFTVSNESVKNQAIVVLVLNYDQAANVDVKVSAAGYATLYYGEKLTIPAGVTAYSASVNGDKIKLTEVADVIPANTGVILEASEGTYNFAETSDAAPTVTGNILVGTTTGTAVSANTVYTLGQDSEGVVGLRLYSGTSIRAYSAYTSSIAPGAPMFMSFDFGGVTTAIGEAKTSVTEKNGVRKYMKNGRLVIENAKGTFNVAGAQMK